MPKVLILTALQFLMMLSLAQDYVLSGTVQEDLSKEPIKLANIYLKESRVGTASSVDGSYSLAIADSLLKDTLVISAIGYKELELPVEALYPETEFLIFLQDSMFLLDEVVAFCYDYVEALYWNSSDEKKKQFLLTFVSKDISNVSNFLLLLKARFGEGKKKNNSFVWRSVDIPGLEGNTKVKLKFFRCHYCPNEENITVTIDINNSVQKDILLDDEYKLLIARYFQEILDQTFQQGINISQLEKRKRIYYLPQAEDAYTGKVYGYFESGKKGLRGKLKDGKKDQRWEYWFENGNKRMVVFFEDGRKEGLWVSWYKNGDLRIKNTYKNGRLEGNNFWWHDNGTLKKISYYKDGIIQGKVEWEKNGNLKEKRGIFEDATEEQLGDLRGLKFQDTKIGKYIKRFF